MCTCVYQAGVVCGAHASHANAQICGALSWLITLNRQLEKLCFSWQVFVVNGLEAPSLPAAGEGLDGFCCRGCIIRRLSRRATKRRQKHGMAPVSVQHLGSEHGGQAKQSLHKPGPFPSLGTWLCGPLVGASISFAAGIFVAPICNASVGGEWQEARRG